MANSTNIQSVVMPKPDQTPTSVQPQPRDRIERRLSIGIVDGCATLNHWNHLGIAATGQMMPLIIMMKNRVPGIEE